MIPIRTRALSFVLAALVSGGVAACGDDGKSLNAGDCPPLPLYTWRWIPADPQVPEIGTWNLYHTNGTAFTSQEVTDLMGTLKQAADKGCVTPDGGAITLNPVTGLPEPR